ncbi:MAG: very-short-patch-repair endonuclease [Brevundimonas sp.]|uniref:endonuclease domain-containing protein n=1 Tax=Brevundimonas sp. TaxID=1871086 RepID=UPI0039E462C1
MTQGGNNNPPFPLDGGRAGDGGDTGSGKPHHLTGAVGRARRLRRDMTFAEKQLWGALRTLNLNIRRQTPIGRYIADFAHHASRLIIEVDGPHHEEIEAVESDLERTAWLNDQGYRVLRFKTRDVTDSLPAVTAAIRSAILSPPSQPFPHQGGRALWRARDQWVRDQ